MSKFQIFWPKKEENKTVNRNLSTGKSPVAKIGPSREGERRQKFGVDREDREKASSTEGDIVTDRKNIMVDIRGWERQKGHSAFSLVPFLYWPLYLGLFMDSYVSPIAAKPFFLGKPERQPWRDRISPLFIEWKTQQRPRHRTGGDVIAISRSEVNLVGQTKFCFRRARSRFSWVSVFGRTFPLLDS